MYTKITFTDEKLHIIKTFTHKNKILFNDLIIPNDAHIIYITYYKANCIWKMMQYHKTLCTTFPWKLKGGNKKICLDNKCLGCKF